MNNTTIETGSLLLTRKQVAELLGVSTRTMYSVVQRGEFPAPIAIFGMPRWEKTTVLDFIEKAKKHKKPRYS